MKFLFWANLLCKFVWNWFVTVWFRLRWSMNWNKFQFLSAQLGQVITSLCLLWVWPKYQYTLLENIIGLYPWPCESGLTLQLISSKSRSQEAWPTSNFPSYKKINSVWYRKFSCLLLLLFLDYSFTADFWIYNYWSKNMIFWRFLENKYYHYLEIWQY